MHLAILTNINSDWMSNAFSGLCCIIYADPLSCILGCNFVDQCAPFVESCIISDTAATVSFTTHFCSASRKPADIADLASTG